MHPLIELVKAQLAGDAQAITTALRHPEWDARRADRCATIADLRALARRSVPRAMFDFVDGAAQDEVTATRNRGDYERWALVPRMLQGLTAVDLRTEVLGQSFAAPLLGAPTGLTGLVHPHGEIGVARAMHAAGSAYVVSALASCSIEELAAAAPGPTWFQLYMWRDRGFVQELLARAQRAGFTTLVVTVDVPRAGARERDGRNGFGIPPRLTVRTLAGAARRPRWAARFVREPRMQPGNAANRATGATDALSIVDYLDAQFDPSVTWADISWLRERWPGPVVVKGLLRPEDAREAQSVGAQAVVVSNHGGRQLDHAPSSIAALPGIVDAVGDDLEVLVDGGIRRGTDIVKALALGARACLVGRPLVYGLAAAGDAGAQRAATILVDELRLALWLLGCASVQQLDRSWIAAAADGTAAASPAATPSS
jgi:L-lactate dehydrogenase (cytochrome)